MRNFLMNESGATAIEYSILSALIALILVGALGSVDGRLSGVFGEVRGAIK